MQEFIKLNDDLLDKVGYLLTQMSDGHAIPFFGINKESWEFDCEEWENHFYPCQVIQGKENYYWAVIKKQEYQLK